MIRQVQIAALLALALLLAAVGGTMADDDDDDQERALEALEAGEIAPLSEILDLAHSQFSGFLLEVELEREEGRWIYEIELLTPTNDVIEIEYDARTKEFIDAKGRNIDAARKR
jgi:uncharacterized membrane protein YkoI